jgi:hypothetical protein
MDGVSSNAFYFQVFRPQHHLRHIVNSLQVYTHARTTLSHFSSQHQLTLAAGIVRIGFFLGNGSTLVRFAVTARDISLLQSIKSVLEIHQACY